MTRCVHIVGLSVVLLALVSCGGGEVSARRETQVDPGPQIRECDANGKKVNLKLFATSDCTPCKKELRALDTRLKTELDNQGCRVNSMVYMVDQAVTQAEADEWAKALPSSFKTTLDIRCRVEFKKQFKNAACSRPAAVILNEADDALKKYPPGTVNLDDMMSTLREALG